MMKYTIAFLLLTTVQLTVAKEHGMPNVLIAVAGLVDESNRGESDAVSGASKSTKGKLHAPTTSGIAARMKEHLEADECRVSVVSTENPAGQLDQFDLIIIGSGIYGMRPHGSVKQFIDANRDVLAEKKVALFAVCGSLCTDSEEHRKKAFRLVDKMENGLSPWRKTVFRGKVMDSGKLFNWVGTKLFKTYPPGDYRQWDVIRDWTLSLLEG